MTMGRYLCQVCYTIVHYGERHPCFYYKDDDAVYVIPQQEDTEEMSSNKENAENLNDDYGNICETAEQTRNTSQALSSPALSVFSVEDKDNKLPRDFTERPNVPEAPINAPSREREMDSHVKQPLELKQDEGAVAGPSAVHPPSLGPGGERQYVCDVCHKQFKRKDHLICHYRIHTGEKPFICDTCGKEFTRKGNLETHLRIHTGEKPFVCDTCGNKFTRKKYLDLHLRTHTGEKPYVCDTCRKEFNQKGNFNRHIRTHTGERLYMCDICGRSLADLRNLKNHVAAHNRGKRYTCSACGETFGSNQDRNRHLREKHQ